MAGAWSRNIGSYNNNLHKQIKHTKTHSLRCIYIQYKKKPLLGEDKGGNKMNDYL